MKQYLRLNDKTYKLEQFKFHLWVKSRKNYDWTFEIYPQDPNNYIMLNSITLGGARTIDQFAKQTFKLTEELASNTVYVDGQMRFLDALRLSFGAVSRDGRTIVLNGLGYISPESDEPAIECEFSGEAVWEAITATGATKDAAFALIGQLLKMNQDEFEITYETAHDGYSCRALPKRI